MSLSQLDAGLRFVFVVYLSILFVWYLVLTSLHSLNKKDLILKAVKINQHDKIKNQNQTLVYSNSINALPNFHYWTSHKCIRKRRQKQETSLMG
jgi:hypothetical protein